MRHLNLIFLSLLLSASLSFAATTPLAPPSLAPAPYAQAPTTLVSNGTDYLAVWSDQRSTVELPDPIGSSAAYSNELDSNGVPLDPGGRRVAAGTVLVPSGGGYLSAGRDAAGAFTVQVSADGTPGAARSGLPATIGDPLALVGNGTTCLLLHTGLGDHNIGLALLAASKNAWLVVWREQHGERYSPADFRILAKRVSFDGVPIDSAPIVVATDPGDPIFRGARPTLAVASDGNDWLVVYPASGAGIRAARVAANGSVLDAAPIGLSRTYGLNSSPHAVWNGSQYLILWTLDPRNPIILSPQPPSSQIHETRVSAAGEFIDTKMLWSGGYGSDLAVAATPERILVMWPVQIDPATNSSLLNVMMLGKDGSPVTAAHTFGSSPVVFPSLYSDIEAAWDGSSFVAAWTEQTRSSLTIRYQHFDASASAIGQSALELEPGGPNKYSPSLAPNGSGATVAFEMIAGGPYGDVARAFTTTLDRVRLFRRRVATR